MRTRTPAGIASAIALAAAGMAFAPQAQAQAVADATTATPLCTAAQLTASIGGGDAGAGQLYTYVVVTNHSSTTCHVTGFPGLSMLDAHGSQIGAAATYEHIAYSPVVLAPGASASDTIHTVNRQTNDPGECLPTSTDLRMYPPGSRASLVFPAKVTNCDHTFTVTPFGPGTTGNPSNGQPSTSASPTSGASATPSSGSTGPSSSPSAGSTAQVTAVPSGAPDTGLASTSSDGGDTGLMVGAAGAGLLVLGGGGAALRRRSQRSRARG